MKSLSEYPLLMTDLITRVVNNTEDNSSLSNYLKVTQDNYEEPITIELGEIVKNIFPVFLCYGIGAFAAYGYKGVAVKAAADNPVDKILNPIGAVLLNFFVNGYFFHLVVASPWDALCNPKPKEVTKALNDLKNRMPGFKGKFLRGLKELVIFSVILGLTSLAAYPMYVLDKIGGDSEIMALMQLVAWTLLQYKGTEVLLFKIIPAVVISPLRKMYYRLSSDAMNKFEIRTDIEILKNAHKEALEFARQEVLRLIQTKNDAVLKQFYILLDTKNPTKQKSMKLLVELLKLVKIEEFHSISIMREIVQFISLVISIVSLPGNFIATKDSVADSIELDDAVKEWLLGSAVFLITVGLTFDVAWIVGGDLYDVAANVYEGIKRAWNQSTSTYLFLKKAWDNKFNFASWHNIIKFPLPMQQNPFSILSTTGILYVLSYWSTQATTYLNDLTLGREKSKYIEILSIIAVMLFNSFPVDKVLGGFQQFLVKCLGAKGNKMEIKLNQFIQNQCHIIDEMDSHKFLNLLNDLAHRSTLKEGDAESLLRIFFGNKTSQQLFDKKHSYAKESSFSKIITQLTTKISDSKLILFPSKKNSEHPPLLSSSSPASTYNSISNSVNT
jgi:hypothetical protein